MADFHEVTWIVNSARIQTLIVYAGQLRETVVMRFAFGICRALDIRRSTGTWWTPAHEYRTVPYALGSLTASVRATIEALFRATGVHRIPGRVIGRAVALRLILVNPARGVHAATHILAQLPSVADAGLVRVAVASGVAGALKSVQRFPALGVHATRPS